MDIQNKVVLVLGAWGLVGNAVTKKIMSHKPKKIIVTSLKKEEAEEYVDSLKKAYPNLPDDYFVPWWGNIFVRNEFKDEDRFAILADPVRRKVLMHDIMDEMTHDVLHESAIYKLLSEYKPDIIVDCINSATGIAYQDIYTTYRTIKTTIEKKKPLEDLVTETEKMLCTLYIPQLIRHIQILYNSMNDAKTEIYVKIGTSGTGGGSNVGFVRWVSNATELNSAWAGIANGSVRSIHLASDITLTQTLVIPAGYNRIIELNGHGAKLIVPANTTGIKRAYNSLTEANAGIDTQLRITDVIFESTNRTAVAIDAQATYGSRIQGCRFYNFGTAIKAGWMMGTIVDQCYFWENNISVDLDYARFTGGSNSASQSNHSVVRDCKFRHSAGQFGAIRAIAVSGLVLEHNIFEGVQAGPQYEVFFDDNSSNVVKEVTIRGCHVEQQPSEAAFHIRLKDGYANIDTVYSQYDCNLIQFDSAAYAKLIVKNIPYLTTNTTFNNVNPAGRVFFEHMPATFDPAVTTKWKNGVPPVNIGLFGWNTNGQSPFIKLAGRTL